jgi:hypothetical protein
MDQQKAAMEFIALTEAWVDELVLESWDTA